MSEENATYITKGSDPQDKIRMALIAAEKILRGDYQGKPGKPVTKSLFGLDLLKRVIEILEKFDVEEIEITLADDETIVFTPTDRKIGIALASRRRRE